MEASAGAEPWAREEEAIEATAGEDRAVRLPYGWSRYG